MLAHAEVCETQTVHDGLLHLAKNFHKHPDVLIGDGNSILGTGMPGSGKTTVMALLLEQFGKCGIPFVTFDLEGDLGSVVDLLPRGVRGTVDSCPTAEEMYKGGLQVVFDLASWGEGSHRAARLITRTVNGLLAYMKSLPSHLRVPFLVGLDEAAYWLPQVRKGCDHLSGEQLEELFEAFHTLAIRGRKMGLIPLLFTQRFAEVHKDVLSPGTYILMRQTVDTDLKRYMEYIDASAFGEDEDDLTRLQMRQRIATFKKGQAIVKLPDGRQGVTQFYNRASLHKSHAPRSVAAVNLYASVPFDRNFRYGADQVDVSAALSLTLVDEPIGSKLSVLPMRGESERVEVPTLKARVYALLENDPTLRSAALASLLGCPVSTVNACRTAYFDQYPQRRPSSGSLLKERVYALLESDPMLMPTALAGMLGCPREQAKTYRRAYFDQYPQRRPSSGPTLKERVYALLENDPTLGVSALASLLDCSRGNASQCRVDYFNRYPQRRPSSEPTFREQVYVLLENDPMLTVTALASLLGCSRGNASQYRIDYFNQYPERRVDHE
jgi:hypothetical protein